MPSMASGRFVFRRLSSTTTISNISNEALFEIPTLDDDQTIVITSPTINLIYKVFFPCLIFIGTCGSIMSLKCLYAQRFRNNNSTYMFFFLIALVDLAILYTGALRLLVIALTEFDVRSTSLFICRAHRFTTYFLLQLSSSLLALMTLDRARKTLSMLPPLKKAITTLRSTQLLTNSDNHTLRNTFLKQSKILWITCFVVLLLLILDSHFFYCTGYQHGKIKHRIICQSVAHNLHCRRYWLLYLWFDAFLYSYLPMLIIMICNVRLVIYLKQQRKRRLALISSTIHLSNNHRITFSVILMSILFLIFSVPVAFLEQFEYKLNHYKYFYHCLAIAYLAMYLNHTISFFLFLFGTHFRQSVKELIWAQATGQPRSNTTLFALVPK
ncbi:unnamed protein product [Adineta steineri]|uniref:G-protein coupled receptors family 1 profile domain-containing protein n=1 Tax=Adineta steineri TaxID=433720 RepID=A0A814AAI4_9BILA|nr:unnamed protein product [Adineta steineri]CAF3553563.1 unnamed protein product [Adineta steineri]